MSGRVIVVDDEKNITFILQAMLEKADLEVITVNDSQQALELLGEEEFDAVLTDLYMPGPGGMEILEYCMNHVPELPVIMMTAYGTVESAVVALKKGAFDFITKPFEQADLLAIVNKAVLTHRQREKEPVLIAREKQASQDGEAQITSIIGQSKSMQEIFKVIIKIAPSPATVFVFGESGTGKELVAFEVHRLSDRATKPFVKINCAAIPATLIESELFGYEKGAFTGAVSSKPGRFELAHEGTLFLDEVAEMPLEMQVKLLRVLQEQEFERVGGVNTIKVSVRIIAATNRDIETEIKAGRFREDLYYRLNVVPIQLPPLRERRDDIELLLRYFIDQLNRKLKKEIKAVDPHCLEALKQYAWPGNIRQLENVVERMVLMNDGNSLGLVDLPEEIRGKIDVSETGPNQNMEDEGFKEIVRRRTQRVERELIEKALMETKWNITHAAEKLKLSRKGLQLKMKELGIKRI